MGRKITIDSATLFNKGLEMIEARWLFDIEMERVAVVIHPQSIVHSLVEFVDGSMLAQLSTPDMCLPIQYALTYPERVPSDRVQTNLTRLGTLTFEEPDTERFPALTLSRRAGEIGGTLPAVLNAANEIAVQAFLAGAIGFSEISSFVDRTMKAHEVIADPTLDQILEVLEQDRDRLVVIDEAYVDFGARSAVSLVRDYDNLVVVQTFSKSRQLAGARLAFAISNPALAAELNTLKFSFNPYSVNRAALAAGEAAMRDREYFDKTRRAIMADREYAAESLRAMGFHVLESKANFIFAAPNGISAGDYFAALRQRGIIVRYWPDSLRIRDYLRITIGTHDQMASLIRATEEILREVN
jgi:hypothetical protein